MANTTDAFVPGTAEHMMPQHEHAVPHLWHRIVLGAVLLLSVFMSFFQLGQNGYGNLYYAAGVRSMGDNWQNFFFVSFDPGGFVTIDKPALGFWLQALSTKIFGFSAFSIFLPQALFGVLAVLLLYYLVRRHFGVVAGLIAALALVVSPISVVTNRNNTIDGTLAFTLLLAAWAIIRAAETGKLRWLLLSGVFVGLGFNIKMAEAFLVIPALVMTYLLCAPRKLWTRVWHLALFVVVAFVLSVSWLLAVDQTPAAQRPYVGSTQTNSEISLAFGYNGLNRVRIGQQNRTGDNRLPTENTRTNRDTTRTGPGGNFASAIPTSRTTANRTAPEPDRGAETGTNLLNLFSPSLGGQIAWLLPFALLAILALAWQRRFHFQEDRQQLGLVLWGMWLLTMATFFTLDSSFHQYYMTEMAPGLSALVGIGLVIMWKDYRSGGWRGWLFPLALIITAAAQIYMLTSYATWSQWLSPLIGGLTALVVIALIVLRVRPQPRDCVKSSAKGTTYGERCDRLPGSAQGTTPTSTLSQGTTPTRMLSRCRSLSTLFTQPLGLSPSATRIAGIAVGIGMLALFVAPTIWSSYSVIHNTESPFPVAGPTSRESISSLFDYPTTPSNRATPTNSALISYLEANQGDTKFLVAVPNANVGASLILATNRPVMAMGGFSGNDPILTTSDLQNLTSNGIVRFFLINPPRLTREQIDRLPEQYRETFSSQDGSGSPASIGGQNALATWISQNCNIVPTRVWQSSTRNTGLGGGQLYDCAVLRS